MNIESCFSVLIKSVIYVHLWLNLIVNEGEESGAYFVRQNHFLPSHTSSAWMLRRFCGMWCKLCPYILWSNWRVTLAAWGDV